MAAAWRLSATVCALVMLAACAAGSDHASSPDARSRHLAVRAEPLAVAGSTPAAGTDPSGHAAGAAGTGRSTPGSTEEPGGAAAASPSPTRASAASSGGGTGTPTGTKAGAPPGASRDPGQPVAGSTGESASPTGATTPAGGAVTTVAPRPFRTVGSITDPPGDAGLLVAPYADVVRVTVDHDGVTARIAVETAGALPAHLAAGEVAGVGVDFYVGDRPSGDYQLFVDGSADGWFAYLYANGEIVRYPGTFLLGGSRMQFELPWADLGGSGLTRFSAFYDWSQDALPANRVGEDHAPQLGTAAIQP